MTESNSNPTVLPPITDSGWFWLYLFCTAGLVALYLAGPRYTYRQPQLERQFSARQRGGQAVIGTDGPVGLSDANKMIITLRPLYVVLAVILAVAWIVFWRQRTRQIRVARSTGRLPH